MLKAGLAQNLQHLNFLPVRKAHGIVNLKFFSRREPFLEGHGYSRIPGRCQRMNFTWRCEWHASDPSSEGSKGRGHESNESLRWRGEENGKGGGEERGDQDKAVQLQRLFIYFQAACPSALLRNPLRSQFEPAH